jgi:hypothetical protein
LFFDGGHMGEEIKQAEQQPVEPVVEQEQPTVNPQTGFLEATPGNASSMRLMSLITVCVGTAICLAVSIAGLCGKADNGQAMQAGITLLSFGMGGKLLQHVSENKAN